MHEEFDLLVLIWAGIGVLLFPVQLWIIAPYGRHATGNWGPVISNRMGWVIMELTALLSFCYGLSNQIGNVDPVGWILSALFMLHYFHRSLVYPFMTRTRGKTMPLLIVLFAVIFNGVNGFVNGYYFSTVHQGYPEGYLWHPVFLFGSILFIFGAIVNIRYDYKLIHLRNGAGKGGYQIPYGGLFRYISCPNHFGEILEWTGFALMAGSLPALSFAIWTWSNLLPRSLAHHRWYKHHFEEYPAKRKAILPCII